jgi:hypothetical protein
MFEFTFKDIPENGSFAGKTFVLPTPSGDKQTKIDSLTPFTKKEKAIRILNYFKKRFKEKSHV